MQKATPFLLAALLLFLNYAASRVGELSICQSTIENPNCLEPVLANTKVRDESTSCHQEISVSAVGQSRVNPPCLRH